MAPNLVADGETLILDAGTTTTEIATRLIGRKNLTVITNALNIAVVLGTVPGFAVHMPGGQFKAPTLSLSGDKSVEYFRNIFAGKLFLATAGVGLDSGLTYPSFADLQLKEAMIKAASHVYLVAVQPRSTAPPSPVWARWSWYIPSSPMTASPTLTQKSSSGVASRC
jgi:DeoR/GlpR family transcriptional regulator of sugar metabolism